MGWPQWIVLLVALQRVVELAVARRNTTRLLAEGGQEHGKTHYPLFVLLHAAWLLALFFLVPKHVAPNPALLALFVLLQACRIWVVVTLGRYWTTRVITLEGAPLVRHGPYRWLRHPNYLVVILELAVLPLAFDAWEIALAFSALNLPLLAWRIRVEASALASRRARTAL